MLIFTASCLCDTTISLNTIRAVCTGPSTPPCTCITDCRVRICVANRLGIHNGDITADNPCYRYRLWVAISCKFHSVSFIISLSENHGSLCWTLSPGVAPIIFLALLLQPMTKHKNSSSLNISISTILCVPTLISLATEPVSKDKWNL